MDDIAYVYWIFDETCSNHLTDGYIGVSKDVAFRFKTHLKKNRVPAESKVSVLFTGNRDECFKHERELRPKKKIGWNNAPGGAHGYRIGFTHSAETKSKLKSAWSDERRTEQAKRRSILSKNSVGQKRPKQSESVSGNKNGMYGNKHSEESKRKMSMNMKGRIAHNKSNTVCPICNKTAPPSVIMRRHGIGKAACK